eukprot:GDKJ01026335.1.p1 GENE.GDKJ01026335.1~~GDKJ01026335.1.p1  ORF type:complete len:425 (+),score=73.43 GDKJ01026335.1:178-1275(+)
MDYVPEKSAFNKIGEAVNDLLGISSHTNSNSNDIPTDENGTFESIDTGRQIFTRTPKSRDETFSRAPATSPSHSTSADPIVGSDDSGPLNGRVLADLQNELRKRAGLNDLIFHPDLEANIRSYIMNGPSCSTSLQHSRVNTRSNISNFLRLGENLWKGHWSPPPTNKDIVDDWYNEINCFNYGPVGRPCSLTCNSQCKQNSPRAGCQTGHFTQMMWGGLTHIGCATYTCNNGSTIAGCVYGKEGGAGGNYMGVLPFEAETAGDLGLNTSTCSAAKHYTFLETEKYPSNSDKLKTFSRKQPSDKTEGEEARLQAYFGRAAPSQQEEQLSSNQYVAESRATTGAGQQVFLRNKANVHLQNDQPVKYV